MTITRDKLLEQRRYNNSQYLSQSIDQLNKHLAQAPKKEMFNSTLSTSPRDVHDIVSKYAASSNTSIQSITARGYASSELNSIENIDKTGQPTGSTAILEEYHSKRLLGSDIASRPHELPFNYDENTNYSERLRQQNNWAGDEPIQLKNQPGSLSKIVFKKPSSTVSSRSREDQHDSFGTGFEREGYPKQSTPAFKGMEFFKSSVKNPSDASNNQFANDHTSKALKNNYLQDVQLERTASADFPRFGNERDTNIEYIKSQSKEGPPKQSILSMMPQKINTSNFSGAISETSYITEKPITEESSMLQISKTPTGPIVQPYISSYRVAGEKMKSGGYEQPQNYEILTRGFATKTNTSHEGRGDAGSSPSIVPAREGYFSPIVPRSNDYKQLLSKLNIQNHTSAQSNGQIPNVKRHETDEISSYSIDKYHRKNICISNI